MLSTTAMYIIQAIHGVAYGMLLFLVASGLTLIFGMMGVLNLAHAAFFMLSAYFCFTVLQITGNFWLSLLLAPVAAAFFGILVERFLLRRVHIHGHIGELLLTLGVMLVILEGVKALWGTESLVIQVPDSLSGLVSLGGLQYPFYRLFIILLALVVLGITHPNMVSALGINTPLVFMLVFGIGTWLAGIAGVAAAPLLTVFPGMADQMGMDAFVVVVVGGLGSLGGAFLASVMIGELNAFGVQFIPRLAPVLMFAFMALVLTIKPTGFFGDRE